LPVSHSGSDLVEISHDTAADDAKLSTLPAEGDGTQSVTQHNMESQAISASEEPRDTAAATEPSTAYPADLAGVGSVHPHFQIPTASLDDELMTDTHNEELVVKSTTEG